MTKFTDHIHSEILNFVEKNLNSDQGVSQDNFDNIITDISVCMEKLGVKENIINEVTSSLSTKFNTLIQSGLTPENSIKETFESLSEIINSNISTDASVEKLSSENSGYDLSFASSMSNEMSILIDEAISKGMSTEEAIKFANNKINQPPEELYGPPNVADYKNVDNANDIIISEDEKNLDKMEADMEDQSNKIDRNPLNENTSLNNTIIDNNNISDPDEVS